MSIIIHNIDELVKQMKICDHEHKLMVIKAGASWCGASRNIETQFNSLSDYYKNFNFFEFNINEVPQLTTFFNIIKIPFFICILPQKYKTITYCDLRHNGVDADLLRKLLETIHNKIQKKPHTK